MAANLPYNGPQASLAANPIHLPDGSVLYPSPSYKGADRELRSMVNNYKDPAYERMLKFEYRRLKDLKKRIRLLRLRSGHESSPEIDCELFEAEYDDKHNLREIKDDGVVIKDEVIEYEALSWCWGAEDADHAIIVRFLSRQPYKKRVSRELALALKYLRKSDDERILWIDALCINQEDYEERNHQVQMMSWIYTQATQVCVWLGEDTDQSQTAIKFIKEEIMKLEKFDDVSSNNKNAAKWQSLMELMQRPWFSRRWVVQEIALANRATIYCGADTIPWTSFAVAVELFVEVETATHRLSEVMQKDERFRYVPNWFEYVSELGASLLVSATAKIFRQYKPPEDATPTSTTSKRGLLSLEYLVSTLFIFEATVPHDAIYSLLAIAKDTSPVAKFPVIEMKDEDALLHATFGDFMERKPYTVDYSRSYPDICKDFVSFCIERSCQSDPARALDILCRPWAPAISVKSAKGSSSGRLGEKPKDRRMRARDEEGDQFHVLKYPVFRRKVKIPGKKDISELGSTDNNSVDVENRPTSDLRVSVETDMNEEGPNKSAISQVLRDQSKENGKEIAGREESTKIRVVEEQDTDASSLAANRSETPASRQDEHTDNDLSVNIEGSSQKLNDLSPDGATEYIFEQDFRETKDYFQNSLQECGHVRKHISRRFPKGPNKFESSKTGTRHQKGEAKHATPARDPKAEEFDLPSWVACIDNAPFGLFKSPGMHLEKMGRKNADPLVALPEDGRRNYSAAQSKSPCLKTLKFKKRPRFRTYSLYVKGFILDEIQEVAPYSQGGAIPKDWFKLGRWHEVMTESHNYDRASPGEELGPPPEFWRTLVADRGKDNRNPPYYYAKACEECVSKGSLSSGRVNVEALINNERNSIIAEFSRRVQAVIWNRKMVRTSKGALGLVSQEVQAGDLVCIVYGCTVPVILRRREIKTRQVVEDEAIEDGFETLKTLILKSEEKRIRKIFYKESGTGSEDVTRLSRRLRTESTDLIKQQIQSWKDAKRSGESSDGASKDRRKKLSETWAELKKALDKEKGEDVKKKDDGEKEPKEPPSIRHLDEAAIKTLEEVFRTYEDAKETVDDRLKVKESKALEGALDEQARIRIRDLHSSYQFLGESYIHGMMDGEAMREQYERSTPEHVFELR